MEQTCHLCISSRDPQIPVRVSGDSIEQILRFEELYINVEIMNKWFNHGSELRIEKITAVIQIQYLYFIMSYSIFIQYFSCTKLHVTLSSHRIGVYVLVDQTSNTTRFR